MIEQEDFEVVSFTVTTPENSSLELCLEDNEIVVDRILCELGSLGVKEVGHYGEFFVTVERDYTMKFEEQYYLVVEKLKELLTIPKP